MPVDREVERVLTGYAKPMQAKLRALRKLILDTAAATDGVGEIEETLKWGQPSYLTKSKSGTTIRIDRHGASGYALFVNCQTNLIDTFREHYPRQFKFDGKRAIVFDLKDKLPQAALSHCIALALTYHQRKRTHR
jgi:hypothetical protein